jgi:DNA (cytosine-5)-methyltransferase 1
MLVGSLFSGIGGIDLGFERAGHDIAWQVEIDPWCREILSKHWPQVPKFEDVTQVGADNLSPVDVLAGGFPCQDVSNAGKRAGIEGARSGLWSEFDRIICDLRPRYVFVENVPGLLVRGMDRVLGDLAAAGYDAEWEVLSAADVGAPHLRKRVWIIAHANGKSGTQRGVHPADAAAGGRGQNDRTGGRTDDRGELATSPNETLAHASSKYCDVSDNNPKGNPRSQAKEEFGDGSGQESVAHPNKSGGEARGTDGMGVGDGSFGNEVQSASRGREKDATHSTSRGLSRPQYQPRKPQSIFSATTIGTFTTGQGWWETEPDVGRVAHGVPKRVDRLRGLGNAVVPQCVEYLVRKYLI